MLNLENRVVSTHFDFYPVSAFPEFQCLLYCDFYLNEKSINSTFYFFKAEMYFQ